MVVRIMRFLIPGTSLMPKLVGETLDAAIVAIHPGGRIVCCGAASLYNGQSYGVKSTMLIVGKFLLLQG